MHRLRGAAIRAMRKRRLLVSHRIEPDVLQAVPSPRSDTPPGSPAVTRVSVGEVVAAWFTAGFMFGCGFGAVVGLILAGILAGPAAILGALIGGGIGLIAGLMVGLLDGLLLAWLRPAPGHAPLAAAAATELILLPVQIWLWFVIHSAAFLPVVGAPSAVSIGVAAALGRRLPPGAGSHTT
jgi:hypothetical protein